jgi:hypothetical protein
VPQSSRTLESSTRISHTHKGSRKACVWRKRALKSQVCCSNGQESCIARDGGVIISHTPKTSRWEDSAHLAVRPQCNSRSDHQRGNGYFQIKFLTVGVGGGLTGPGGGQTAIYTGAGDLTGQPWRSDRIGTGAGGLSAVRAYFGHQKSISSAKDFLRFSTDSNLETTQKSLRTNERNGGAHSEVWTTFS